MEKNTGMPDMVMASLSNASQACAQRHAARPRELDASILRLGSVAARDVLAYQLSNGTADYAEICDAVLSGSIRDVLHRSPQVWQSDGLLRLARIVAFQDLLVTDRPVAFGLLWAILEKHGRKALPGVYRKLLVELAIHLGSWDVAETVMQLLPTTLPNRGFLEADLKNPHVRTGSKASAWLDLVNSALPTGSGSLSLDSRQTKLTGDITPFGCLVAAEDHPLVDGPLVTIGVACWCPDGSLLTSLRSLLAQTWKNIEIVVVDDCSPVEYAPMLEKAAALDSRIRVLVQPVNGGTYCIRNRVLEHARGEFFTVQDADDWAHPLRIQRQVEALLARQDWMACHCLGFRCNDDLQFNYIGVAPWRVNESSLLFRRQEVVSAVGYYHASRKGADSEYTSRIRRYFGDNSIGRVEHCLTGIRLSTGSLSRSEFKPGWRHPGRAIYRRNYERWQHQSLFAKEHLGINNFNYPSFIAPYAFQPERLAGRAYLDYVFVGDFRASNCVGVSRALKGLRSLLERGLSVAICHADTLLSVDTQGYEEYDLRVLELLANDLTEVSIADSIQAGKVIFLNAAVLQYMDLPHAISLLAHEAWLLMDCQDIRGDEYGPYFDTGRCLDRIFSITGSQPRCLPCDVESRMALHRYLPAAWISDNPPWLNGSDDELRTGPAKLQGACIGVHLAREGEMYSQSWILQARAERIRISVPSFNGRYEFLPDNVRIYVRSRGEQDFFTEAIDVLIIIEEWDGHSALSDAIITAQERGITVHVPVSWKASNQDGLVYFDPKSGPKI